MGRRPDAASGHQGPHAADVFIAMAWCHRPDGQAGIVAITPGGEQGQVSAVGGFSLSTAGAAAAGQEPGDQFGVVPDGEPGDIGIEQAADEQQHVFAGHPAEQFP